MKKGMTVFLVGGILIVCGLILILAAVFIGGGGNFTYVDEYTKEVFIPESNFNKITINQDNVASSVDILVVGSDRTDVFVEYYETSRFKMEVVQEGRNLVFDCNAEGSIFNNVMHFYKEEITIFVPNEYFDNLTISSTSSDVSISNLVTNNLTINTTSGDIKVNSTEVLNNININLTSGLMDLNYIKANELNLNNTSGNTAIKDSKVYNVFAETVSGEVSIDGVLVEDNIEVETVSGSILLYLPGYGDEYNKDISTISGSSNVKDETFEQAKKLLKLKTVSGRIYVYYLDWRV